MLLSTSEGGSMTVQVGPAHIYLDKLGFSSTYVCRVSSTSEARMADLNRISESVAKWGVRSRKCCKVRDHEIGTEISETRKRVPVFLHNVRGGK